MLSENVLLVHSFPVKCVPIASDQNGKTTSVVVAVTSWNQYTRAYSVRVKL